MPPGSSDRRRPPQAPASLPSELTAVALADLQDEVDARRESEELIGALGPEAVVRSPTLSGCRVTGALAGAMLRDAHLLDTVLQGCDLANARLPGGALHRVAVRGCRGTGAQLIGASLRDVTVSDGRFDLAVLADAKLDRVTFTDCDLQDATFEQAVLRDVRFERCDLSGVSFGQVRLQRVELVECRLHDVRSLSDLRGAALPWPDLVGNAGALAAALGIHVLEDVG